MPRITLLKMLLPALSLTAALVWVGCLGAFGGEDTFVDESPVDQLGVPRVSSEVGGFCRSSLDCAGGLRCLASMGFQFCVETCDTDAECSTNECNPVVSDVEGYCSLPTQSIGSPSSDSDSEPVGSPPTDSDPDPDPDPDLDPDPTPTPDTTSGSCGNALESEQFQFLNADRVANGLSALTCHTGVGQVARAHSQDMSDRNYFDHVNPEGEQPWDRLERGGVSGWSSVGENIAYGYPTAEEVQEGWMGSPGHRANILDGGFTHVGIGAVTDPSGQIYWTQVFARF